MTVAASLERSFSVHGLEEAPSRGQRVEAINFQDAALAFLEAHHPQVEAAEVSLLVEDCETGERQCFRVDVATGETAPCD
ncbi:MAG: hypothetical protein JWP49_2435 [Phenylobacterium sp.]|nr:hypothetical protein [Phenylobacterium sp.]